VQARRRQPFLLILVLLLHVLALWLLARQHGMRLPKPVEDERITWLLPVTPPRAQLQPAAPAPRQRAAPRERISQAVGTRPIPSAVPQAAVPTPTPVPVEAPHRLSGAEILEQAKRDMPRIERELRNNVPTKLTLSPDSFRAKLEKGIADAFVGGDQRVTVDFYTSPDNVHYMRMTKGGKTWCTMNGGPVTLARANGIGVDKDTKVNCPPAAPTEWKDMPYLID
jgi:hypothetical protein